MLTVDLSDATMGGKRREIRARLKRNIGLGRMGREREKRLARQR